MLNLGINKYKSILLPTVLQSKAMVVLPPLKWVEEFKYLGIQVCKELNSFYTLNVYPALFPLREKCASLANLLLNLMAMSTFSK